MIKAYLIVFESKKDGIRYLCTRHAQCVMKWKEKAEIKFFSMIHSDVYDKKCHLCKGKK